MVSPYPMPRGRYTSEIHRDVKSVNLQREGTGIGGRNQPGDGAILVVMKLVRSGLIAGLALVAASHLALAGKPGAVPLDRAASLLEHHRYQQALTLLEPYADRQDLDATTRFWINADLGVSYFHLARYELAYKFLGRAGTLEPRNAQMALYREAAAWVTGRREEALKLFEGILSSGAKNLFPAITLPGERQFLADPRTWRVLLEHAIPLEANLEAGTFAGIGLGSSREDVAKIFHLGGTGAKRPVLQASAGPRVLWAFSFDDTGRVSEILIDAQNVLRYSPYTIALDRAHDWKTTVAGVLGLFGRPTVTHPEKKHGLILRWNYKTHFSELEFGAPVDPPPPMIPAGTAIFRMIRMTAIPHTDAPPK